MRVLQHLFSYILALVPACLLFELEVFLVFVEEVLDSLFTHVYCLMLMFRLFLQRVAVTHNRLQLRVILQVVLLTRQNRLGIIGSVAAKFPLTRYVDGISIVFFQHPFEIEEKRILAGFDRVSQVSLL